MTALTATPPKAPRPRVSLRGGLWRIDCCPALRGAWHVDFGPAMDYARMHARLHANRLAENTQEVS